MNPSLEIAAPTAPRLSVIESRLDQIARLAQGAGGALLSYGLVGILLYYGAFKFHPVEAQAIQPLIANSPLMSWMYSVLSVQGVSNLLGVAEILIALGIAARPLAPKVSALASLGAAGMFATTLTFLFSTPGAWVQVPGFPLPVTSETAAFLLKDVFLLGAALWSAGESWSASRRS